MAFPPPAPQNVFNAPRNAFLVQYFSNITKLVDPTDLTTQEVFQRAHLLSNDPLYTAENIYGLMCTIPYITDQKPYWQRPSETLVRDAGDCEDHSILESTFFELGGLYENYFVITSNVNWREYHVANLVHIPQTQYHRDSYLYLDSSYPHPVGSLPFYADRALVYGFFSTRNPVSNPMLAANPIPLSIFMDNAALAKMIGFQ